MIEPRKLPIHQSLVREKLLAGGERDLVLLAAGVGALPAASGNLKAMAAGLAFWLVSMIVLRRLAKIDPQMSIALTRYFNYQSTYPALPSFIARSARSRRHQR
jgi:type IV secretory pathway TrbD component